MFFDPAAFAGAGLSLRPAPCQASGPREISGKMPTLTQSPLPTLDGATPPTKTLGGLWGASGPWERRFRGMLAASLLVHVVLTPFPALLGLLGLLGPLAEELPPEDELIGIPVDLVADEPEVAAALPEPPAPAPAPAAPTVTPEPEGPDPAPLAPAVPAEPKAPATPPAEPPAEPAAKKDGGDPVALSGAAGKLADSNANVRILLYTDVVRSHPLGARIGGLLKRSPQWSDFFGPTSVDPIRDIDRVLIAGPELRDTKNIVAVIGHHLPEAEIDQALERLVARNGEWISRSPRLAKAKADRATRLFAAPKNGIVAVAPPSVEASLKKLGRKLSFPEAAPGTAAHIYLKEPQKTFRAMGLRLPETIRWVTIVVVPDPDGGVHLRLDSEDESEAAAKEHADSLEVALRKASEIDFSKMGSLGALAAFAFGTTKKKVVDSIELEARGDHIAGLVHVTARQLLDLADLLDAILPPPAHFDPAPPAVAEPEKKATEAEAVEPKAPELEPTPGGTTPAAADGVAPAPAPSGAGEAPAESPPTP